MSELTEETLLKCQAVAVGAALSAGEVIETAFHQPKNISHKGDIDLVTETDKACEKLILGRLREEFPTYKFIGEEEASATGSVPDLTDEPTWMVDPIDGTTNFIHGLPYVAISLGLCVNKRPILGVVYNPILKEMTRAVEGKGAFINDQPIQVSEQTELLQSLIGTELGTQRNEEFMSSLMGSIESVIQNARSLRSFGSCALDMVAVAAGRFDGFFELKFGGCWDVAAGAVIVREAGGEVVDPSGREFDVMACRVLATNGKITPALLENVKGVE